MPPNEAEKTGREGWLAGRCEQESGEPPQSLGKLYLILGKIYSEREREMEKCSCQKLAGEKEKHFGLGGRAMEGLRL